MHLFFHMRYLNIKNNPTYDLIYMSFSYCEDCRSELFNEKEISFCLAWHCYEATIKYYFLMLRFWFTSCSFSFQYIIKYSMWSLIKVVIFIDKQWNIPRRDTREFLCPSLVKWISKVSTEGSTKSRLRLSR